MAWDEVCLKEKGWAEHGAQTLTSSTGWETLPLDNEKMKFEIFIISPKIKASFVEKLVLNDVRMGRK